MIRDENLSFLPLSYFIYFLNKCQSNGLLGLFGSKIREILSKSHPKSQNVSMS
ncbi:hypothetical protein THIOM_001171 [Candidatus Thiomargarita nelsonii]|uniref:Uncharacterized protein n=1 Tax=Candidatus Thiomargarita nelsonii TaxID=1003181 RepID=A0A176S4S4_9GAMM|nr:hypothetical protein THIOM_001171 [Candidatus Thiomargarita nelsonii]